MQPGVPVERGLVSRVDRQVARHAAALAVVLLDAVRADALERRRPGWAGPGLDGAVVVEDLRAGEVRRQRERVDGRERQGERGVVRAPGGETERRSGHGKS